MRRRILLPAVLLGALAWAVPAQVSAVEMLSLSDVRCDGFTLTGTGLPANATLPITVSEELDSPVVKRFSVRTDAKGAFTTDVRVSLAGMGEVYVAARRPSGGRMVMGEHEFATACPLPFTGPRPLGGLLAASIALLGAGALLAMRFTYQGRHVHATAR